MKLEEQVSSLELSKKLKSLGVKQESAFYWLHDIYGDWVLKRPSVDLASDMEIYAAFTVAELFKLLLNDGWEITFPDIEAEDIANYLAEVLCQRLKR